MPSLCTQYGKKPLYCGEHKKDGMIDVISKRCIQDDCKKQSSCNIEDEKPLYCGEHKKDGMINSMGLI